MTYSVRADSEDIFGRVNISKWADLDSSEDEDEISARIERAIEQTYAELNAKLRNGPYEVPFESPYDPIIVDLSATLVGIILYDGRGITDSDPGEFDQLARHRKKVDRFIADLHGMRLALNHKLLSTTYPQATG